MVALFIGLLNDKISPGTYPALQVLQQARMMNKLYILGWTTPLVTKMSMKAAGFLVNAQRTKDILDYSLCKSNELDAFFEYYELTRMSAKQRVDYLIQRSIKRSKKSQLNILDLSYSADPLSDLKLMESSTCENIKRIDISWSYFLESEMKDFFDLISMHCRKLTTILVSQAQPHFDWIFKTAKQRFTVIERLDAAKPQEIPAFPVHQATNFGLYDLPHRILSEPPCTTSLGEKLTSVSQELAALHIKDDTLPEMNPVLFNKRSKTLSAGIKESQPAVGEKKDEKAERKRYVL